ncbi:barstar (barnase inhibitor) [Frondihabitans sp. PhB188]|uniref:barstar family protein n=1 Tax=Frondihabitans sp. PhB188 TaxID=2485200 RepID=UPI000F482A77|nr:barstar family protein [Frondihabitans sp. PhB188]ROQ30296.1 barstar (barnase inhibitor) [Frondihabitans sp. PhB188]
MPAWTTKETFGNPIDFDIARNGFHLTISDRDQREHTLTWLQDHGYRLVRFDASLWADEPDMLTEIGTALDFPDYYGVNLDALNDCLSDVAEHDYGWKGDEIGLVLVVTAFEAFHRVAPKAASSLLSILAGQSLYAALFGNRILTITS